MFGKEIGIWLLYYKNLPLQFLHAWNFCTISPTGKSENSSECEKDTFMHGGSYCKETVRTTMQRSAIIILLCKVQQMLQWKNKKAQNKLRKEKYDYVLTCSSAGLVWLTDVTNVCENRSRLVHRPSRSVVKVFLKGEI